MNTQPLEYDLLDSALILVVGDWSTLLGRVAKLLIEPSRSMTMKIYVLPRRSFMTDECTDTRATFLIYKGNLLHTTIIEASDILN